MIRQLDQRLTLWRDLRAPDGAGGSTLSWQIVDDFWGRIDLASATEAVADDRPDSVRRARAHLRRRSDCVAGRRLTGPAGTFRIVGDVSGSPRDALMVLSLVEDLT